MKNEQETPVNNLQKSEPHNVGLEFEQFLRFEFPELLNLSQSKRVATEQAFYHFSDYANMIMGKSSRENKLFLSEFKKRARTIFKFRAPKGYKVVPNFEELRRGIKKYHLSRKLT